MKFMQLLHRYLDQRNASRNARRRKAKAGSPAGLIDTVLEPRTLLSGTTPEVSVDNSAQASETSSSKAGEDSPQAGRLVAFANDSNVPVQWNFDSLRVTASIFLAYTESDHSLFVVADTGTGASAPTVSQTTVSSSPHLSGSGNLSILPETLPLAGPLASHTGPLSTRSTATTSPVEQLPDAKEVGTTTSTRHSKGTPHSTAATVKSTVSPSTQLQANIAFTDPEANLDTPSPSSQRRVTHSRRAGAFETLTTNSLQQRRLNSTTLQSNTQNTEQQQQSSNHSVSNTSISNVVAQISNLAESLIQFDTIHLNGTNDIAVDEWLSEQLGFSGIDQRLENPANKESIDACVEQATTEETHEDNQRLQNAWLRLDLQPETSGVLAAPGDTPPEPPDISGIWQRLKFDSNPRGPPVSDHIPASEFTRLTANAMQLKQLRHSIAPRGPSAASVR